MKTKNLRTLCLAAFVAASCILPVPAEAKTAENESSALIIGGADGPTSIFLAGKLSGGEATEDYYEYPEGKLWNCSVTNPVEDETAIVYSDVEIQTDTGKLTFQNSNDFPITVSLYSQDSETLFLMEGVLPAGASITFRQLSDTYTYTVGIHADVPEGTEILVFASDADTVPDFCTETDLEQYWVGDAETETEDTDTETEIETETEDTGEEEYDPVYLNVEAAQTYASYLLKEDYGISEDDYVGISADLVEDDPEKITVDISVMNEIDDERFQVIDYEYIIQVNDSGCIPLSVTVSEGDVYTYLELMDSWEENYREEEQETEWAFETEDTYEAIMFDAAEFAGADSAGFQIKDQEGEVLIEDCIKTAEAATVTSEDGTTEYVVKVTLRSDMILPFTQMTEAHIGETLRICVDDVVLSEPTLVTTIKSGEFILSDDYSYEEANEIADLIMGDGKILSE